MENLLWDEETRYRVRLYRSSTDCSDLGVVAHHVRVTGDIALIQTESAVQQAKDCMKLKTSSDTLAPLALEWSIQAPKGLVEIVAEFKGNKVRARAKTDQGEQKLVLDISDDCYDNGSAFYVLRGIALGRIQRKRIYFTNLSVGATFEAEVSLMEGEEAVETLRGTVACIGVALRLPDLPRMPVQRFYFQKAEPHALLKNVCGPQVIELMET
jgi:hypothetical protein